MPTKKARASRRANPKSIAGSKRSKALRGQRQARVAFAVNLDPQVQVSFRVRKSVYRQLVMRAARQGVTLQTHILTALLRDGLRLRPRDLADRRRTR